MATENKKILIPKLRFKGFKDEWDEVLLGETCTVKTGGKDTQDRIEDGKYPFFVRSNTVERINSYSFDGEAILTSGDGVGVGKNFHYINSKFDFHQRVYALHTFKDDYSGKFVYHFFVEKFYKRVMRLSAKNSVDSVRMSMITEMIIGAPNLQEQQKIATFLTAVDDKIQQLTQKKTLLEQYKKGAMQQIFSQQLRFKPDETKQNDITKKTVIANDGEAISNSKKKQNSSDAKTSFPDWEEKKLGEVCDVRDGTHDSPKYKSEGYPLITSKNLMKDGSIDFDNVNLISEIDFENINKRSGVNIGDILFGMIGTIGNPVIVQNEGFAIKNVALIKENIVLKNYFLIHYLSSDLILKQFYEQNTGGTQKFIALGVIRNLVILVPSLKEQQKIATYLSAIDTKIENVQTQIAKTQTFKKGLLQQLFV